MKARTVIKHIKNNNNIKSIKFYFGEEIIGSLFKLSCDDSWVLNQKTESNKMFRITLTTEGAIDWLKGNINELDYKIEEN